MESHQSFNRLEALYEISNALVSEHDLSAILDLITTKIMAAGRYSLASVYMINGQRINLHATLSTFPHSIPYDHSMPLGVGLLGKTISTRKTIVINRVEEDPTYINIFKLPIRSATCLPLIKGNELYGAILIGSTEADYFTDDDVSFLKAISETASVAIHNAFTFRLLQATSKISSLISSTSDVIQVLPDLISELHKLIAFDGLLITRPHYYRMKEMVVYPMYMNTLQTQIYQSYLPMPGSATEHVMSTSEMQLINDINTSVCYAEDQFVKSIEPKSVIRIPLQTLNKSEGVIHFYSKEDNCFGEREVRFLQESVRQLSPTIHNVISINNSMTNTKLRKMTQIMNNELLATTNVEKSLLKIARLLEKYLEFDRVFVWHLAGEREELHPIQEEIKPLSISFSDSHLLAQALLTRKSQFFSNLKDLSVIHESLSSIIASSLLVIPLYDETDQQMTGVMVALDMDNPYRFSVRTCELTDQLIRPLGSHIHRKNREYRLERNHLAMIKALTIALDKKDSETEGHSERVVHYSVAIAERLGISEAMMKRIRWGALLHDIGKIGIPDAILKKPAKLTDEEWDVMRKHPVIGYEMISGIEFLEEAIDIVLYHHEKVNGTGYPHQLRGEDIPLPARVFAIADAFDAITSSRPYKIALSIEQARNIILKDSGTHFCPMCVEAFLGIPIENLAAIKDKFNHKANIGERVLV